MITLGFGFPSLHLNSSRPSNNYAPDSLLAHGLFLLATVLSLPKLLAHIFIGSRLGELSSQNMDKTSRLINYLTIFIGGLLFIIATWYVYKKTNEIAAAAAKRRSRTINTNSNLVTALTRFISDTGQVETFISNLPNLLSSQKLSPPESTLKSITTHIALYCYLQGNR